MASCCLLASQFIQVMIRVHEEKEEEFVYIKFPPVPEGTYVITTVVLDARRLSAGGVWVESANDAVLG